MLSRLERALSVLPADPSAISCRLTPEDLAGRGREWRAVAERLEVVDAGRFSGGFRLVLRGGSDDLDELSRLVTAERECCGWASWELEERPGERTLTVSGEEELIAPLASAFLRDD